MGTGGTKAVSTLILVCVFNYFPFQFQVEMVLFQARATWHVEECKGEWWKPAGYSF